METLNNTTTISADYTATTTNTTTDATNRTGNK